MFLAHPTESGEDCRLLQVHLLGTFLLPIVLHCFWTTLIPRTPQQLIHPSILDFYQEWDGLRPRRQEVPGLLSVTQAATFPS